MNTRVGMGEEENRGSRVEPSSTKMMDNNIAIQDPVSPSMSIASPVFHLPGAMPTMSSALAGATAGGGSPRQSTSTQDTGIDNGSSSDAAETYARTPQQPGKLLGNGLPSLPSTSGITSFLRSFSLSSSPPSAGHAVNVSGASDGAPHTSVEELSPSSSRQQDLGKSLPSSCSQISSPFSSSSPTTMSQQLPTATTSTVSDIAPTLNGGTQVKRAFSNSSAARRMRKLSNPIPSFLGGSNSGIKDSPTSNISSPLAESPVTATATERETRYRNSLTPRHSYLRDANSTEDQLRTPTQPPQNSSIASLQNAGSDLINSSIGFLSSLASFDRFPSVLGLSNIAAKSDFPRGEDSGRSDLMEDMDLRIEDATGDMKNLSDSSPMLSKADVLDSPLSLANPLDNFQPNAFSRTGTSTTLESNAATSSRNALSTAHSNLTYASSSSVSSHNPEETDLRLASPSTPSDNPSVTKTTLDPVTFQALRRKNSLADARRVEREREVRGRQLDLLDRLQEQAENPHLKTVPDSTVVHQHSSTGKSETAQSAGSPFFDVLQSPSKATGIGMGLPSSIPVEGPPADTSGAVTPGPKKTSRRKSLFSRLGFSPARQRASSSSSPVPQVRLPQSDSVASFASAGGASSLAESFQAVAEATPGTSLTAASSSLRTSSSVVDLGLPPLSDTGSPSIAVSSVNNSKSASGSRRKSRYVKTKVKNKSKREFNHLFLAQELDCNTRSNTSLLQALPDSSSSPTEAVLPETPASSAFSVVTTPPIEKSTKSSKAGKKAASKDGSQATWSLKFSTDGNYLASAGQDGIIRIWQVIAGSDEREETVKAMDAEDLTGTVEGGSSGISIPAAASFADGLQAANSTLLSKQDKRNSKISIMSNSTQGHSAAASSPAGNGKRGNAAAEATIRAPVFGHKPLHEWKGHTSDVLDLSWSKNNFLISSSMDKTVRLWHVSRKECLCAFQHPDFVTSIAFHPKDDRYFLSGSLDAKLRLWSIPDKKVHCWTQLPELITSVAFTSDGKIACAGTFVGLCLFFDVRDLAFIAKLHSRSSRGKYAKGRKITSIVVLPKGEPSEPERILVTSNDSRLRLWDISSICGLQQQQNQTKPGAPRLISERHLDAKYKAHENTSSQIKAGFSDDGKYVISGSEDRQCYIWMSGLLDFPKSFAQTAKKGADKSPGCESFNPSFGSDSHCPIGATPGIVTCAVFAPSETQNTLARGGDPLFGSEGLHEHGLHRSPSQASSSASSHAHDKPAKAYGSLSSRSGNSASGPSVLASPSRDMIIITADDTSGKIRVFRNSPIYSLSAQLVQARSVSSSAHGDYFLGGDASQRRASQLSKISRTTSRLRGSLDRQRQGEHQEGVEEVVA